MLTISELLRALRPIEFSGVRRLVPAQRRDYSAIHDLVELGLVSQFVPSDMLTPLAQYLSPDLEERSNTEVEDALQEIQRTSQSEKQQAYFRLKSCAPFARIALPAWVKGLEDDDRDVREISMSALIGYKIHALPELIQAVSRSKTDRVWRQAVRLIQKLGRAAHAAIPTLFCKLKEQQELSAQVSLLVCLRGIGGDLEASDQAVELLLSILRISKEAYRNGNNSIRAREIAEHCLGLISLMSAQREKLLHFLAKVPEYRMDPIHKAVCHAVAMLYADELEEAAWWTLPIFETQWDLHMAGFSKGPPITAVQARSGGFRAKEVTFSTMILQCGCSRQLGLYVCFLLSCCGTPSFTIQLRTRTWGFFSRNATYRCSIAVVCCLYRRQVPCRTIANPLGIPVALF